MASTIYIANTDLYCSSSLEIFENIIANKYTVYLIIKELIGL